jgi:hypothetical protein
MKHIFLVRLLVILGGAGAANAATQPSYSSDENEAAWVLAGKFAPRPVTPPPAFAIPEVRSPLTPRRMGQPSAENGPSHAAARLVSAHSFYRGAPGEKIATWQEERGAQNHQPVFFVVPRVANLFAALQEAPVYGGLHLRGHVWGGGVGLTPPVYPAYSPVGPVPVYAAGYPVGEVRYAGAVPASYKPLSMQGAVPASCRLFHLAQERPDLTPPESSASSPVEQTPATAPQKKSRLQTGASVKRVSTQEGVHKKKQPLKKIRILTDDMYEVLKQFERENEQSLQAWDKAMLVRFLQAQPEASPRAAALQTLLKNGCDNKYFTALNQTLNKRKRRLIEEETQAPWTEESQKICRNLYKEFAALQGQQNLPVTIDGTVKFINQRQGNFFVTAKAREFLGNMIRRENKKRTAE